MALTKERPATPAPPETEDLFEEARRRRRRRRLLYSALAVLVIAGALVAWATTSSRKVAPSSRPRSHSSVSIRTTPAEALADPEVAWVDYNSQLHIGNVLTGTQEIVASADADPTTPLVVEGDWIWWARTAPLVDGQPPQVPPGGVGQSYSGLVGFNRATGRTVSIPKATQVFPSLDRHFLYAVFSPPGAFSGYWTGVHRPSPWRTIGEYTPDGRSLGRSYVWPKGWTIASAQLLGNPSPVTANGILVQSPPDLSGKTPSRLGIWNLSTGHVRELGTVWKVDNTYTPPGARNSLVAWLPGACGLRQISCSLRITNTATLATWSVRNPLGNDFNWGGAFSPNGQTLAVFLAIVSGKDGPATELGLLDLRTRQIQAVPGARINVGDALAWALWLPDGNDFLAGAVGGSIGNGINPDNHYLVDASTHSISPFSFLADGNQDVNFSVALLDSL